MEHQPSTASATRMAWAQAPRRSRRVLLGWVWIATAAMPAAPALAARSHAATLPVAKVSSSTLQRQQGTTTAWLGVLMFLGIATLAGALLARSAKTEESSVPPPPPAPPDPVGSAPSSRWAEVESLRQALTDQQRQIARIQEELTAARKLAQDAEAARRDILAQISREIRTPMAAIRGYAQMIGGGCLGHCEHGGGVVREAVAGIDCNARQLLDLVDDRLRCD